MTRTTLPLVGLEADNLLAFLALLGTLRALEAAKPEWRTRCRWSGPPWHPELDLPDVPTDDVVSAIAEGVAECARDVDFRGRKNIDFSVADFRAFAERSLGKSHASTMAAALGSDACTKHAEDRIEGNAVCAMYGQGWQNFLERIDALGRRPLGEDLAELGDALLSPWTYTDRALTLRWDPLEDRRYALGFANPSGEDIRTSAGANVLAAVGFPLLTTAPGPHHLLTTASRRDGRAWEIRWPIWAAWCGLATVRALLRHPDLYGREGPDSGTLHRRGVVAIRRSRRIQAGKYFNFERAASIWSA